MNGTTKVSQSTFDRYTLLKPKSIGLIYLNCLRCTNPLFISLLSPYHTYIYIYCKVNVKLRFGSIVTRMEILKSVTINRRIVNFIHCLLLR